MRNKPLKSQADQDKGTIHKKRSLQRDAKPADPSQSPIQTDKTILQQGLGNEIVSRMMASNGESRAEQESTSGGEQAFSSILTRQTGPPSNQIQREPQLIEVAPANPEIGNAANNAAAEPFNDGSVAEQNDKATIRQASPQFAAAEKKAAFWNKTADAIGAGAPLLALVVTAATGGTGTPAVSVINGIAKGLTILCKEMEKAGLVGEIDALTRMLPYVSTADNGQYLLWKQRINEFSGKIARAEVKEIKTLLTLFEPPMVVGAAEFAGSLAYKKKIEAETKALAAQKANPTQIIQWLKDREIQRQQEKGEFAPVIAEGIDPSERENFVIPDERSKWKKGMQKLTKMLPGKRKVNPSPYEMK